MCMVRSVSRSDLIRDDSLVMLLLMADLFKSFWLVLFPAYALKHSIQSGDDFCQVGGFFLQMSLEACGM